MSIDLNEVLEIWLHMSKKYLVAALSSISFAGPVSAQIADSTGYQGIIPLITQILGIDVGDPYQVIGVVATFGIISLVNYIVLKKAFMRMDMLDVVNLGGSYGDEGRNILAIIAVLMTLSILGTGAFTGIINGFRSIILLLFFFMVIGGLAIVIGGGSFLTFGGIAQATGKGVEESAKGIQKGADALDKAGNVLSSAEEEEEEGRRRGESGDRDGEHDEEADAERKLNRVLEILDYVEGDFQEVLTENKERIQDAIDDLERAEEDEEAEERAEQDIQQRVQRAHVFVTAAVEEIKEDGSINTDSLKSGRRPYEIDTSSFGYGGAYGLEAVGNDMEMGEKRLNQIVSNINEEEGFIGEGLKELIEAAREVVQIHKYTYELQELLKEAESDTEFMEKLSEEEKFKDLYEDARDADRHEKEDLEPKLNNIKEEEEELFEYLKKADELVEKHLSLNSTLITLLEDKTSKGGTVVGIRYGVGELLSDLNSLLTEANKLGATEIENMVGLPSNDGTILYYVNDISDHVSDIDSELNSEYKKEQEGIQELEEYLDSWS
jgi:hypothetical protein